MNKAARIHFKKGKKLATQGNSAGAISSFEAALSESPNNPDILFALGNFAKSIELFPIAEQMFRVVYGLLPDSIEAATNLAVVINEQDRVDEAIEIYQALLVLNPEHVPTWVNVGNSVLLKGDLETAEIFYNEALRLNPNTIEALTNLANIYIQRRSYSEALKLIDKALKKDKRNAIIRFSRAEVLLHLGQLEDGWQELEFASQNRKDRQKNFHHHLKKWNGESLAGQKILLTCDQGIGDQMRFINCIENAIKDAAEVVVEIDERLVDLFQRTYPEVAVKPLNCTRKTGVTHFNYDWPVNNLDYADTMLGLYRYYRPTIDSFPVQNRFYKIDKDLDAKWKMKVSHISDEFNVGVCWRSGKQSLKRNVSYPDLNEWAPIFAEKSISFFNLMYDECEQEVSDIKEKFDVELIVFDDVDYKNDLDDVFALTKQLDMVVSVGSTPACISGVLGVETYKMLPGPTWEMFGTDKYIMTPDIHPIFQESKDDWSSVMNEIAEIIRQKKN
jgi:tetratricopeptide (TPR) repeat protein